MWRMPDPCIVTDSLLINQRITFRAFASKRHKIYNDELSIRVTFRH